MMKFVASFIVGTRLDVVRRTPKANLPWASADEFTNTLRAALLSGLDKNFYYEESY